MDRADIILLLFYPHSQQEDSSIVGTTRLQKFLFLLEVEEHVKPDQGESFNFTPYRFGPASKSLYDDLAFLVNLGLISKSNEPALETASSPADDFEELSASELLSHATPVEADDPESETEVEEAGTAADDAVVYNLTEKGRAYIRDNDLLASSAIPAIVRVKKKYGRYSLSEILRYVYTKYPAYATESEILDKF